MGAEPAGRPLTLAMGISYPPPVHQAQAPTRRPRHMARKPGKSYATPLARSVNEGASPAMGPEPSPASLWIC